MKNFLLKLKQFSQSVLLKIKSVPASPVISKAVQTVSGIWKNFKIYLKTTKDFTPPAKEKVVSFVLKWWHWLLGGVFAFLVLYYPAGAILTHQIDDDPFFMAKREKTETPKMPATLYSLIDREINRHVWTPNLPFFFPSSVLDNMPSYQLGMINAVYKTTQTLSRENPEAEELARAAEYLGATGTKWYVSNWKPSVSANRQYQKARIALMTYEKQLDANEAVFNTDKQALDAVLSTLSGLLNESAQKIDRQVRKYEKRPVDLRADNVFYRAKGNAYVVYLMLRDLKEDFKDEMKNKELARYWTSAIDSLERMLNIRPFFIVNGEPETQFLPNHLLNLGFYIADADAQIRRMLMVLNVPEA